MSNSNKKVKQMMCDVVGGWWSPVSTIDKPLTRSRCLMFGWKRYNLKVSIKASEVKNA